MEYDKAVFRVGEFADSMPAFSSALLEQDTAGRQATLSALLMHDRHTQKMLEQIFSQMQSENTVSTNQEYQDSWVCLLWNYFRVLRIWSLQTTVVIFDSLDTDYPEFIRQGAIQSLNQLSDEICASFEDNMRLVDGQIGGQSNPNASGGYLMIWPLYFAAANHGTCINTRNRILDHLRNIWEVYGTGLALTLSKMLENDQSFNFLVDHFWVFQEQAKLTVN